MKLTNRLDKLLRAKEDSKSNVVTTKDLIKEHEKYCASVYGCKSHNDCTECFAIFTVNNFNIERK